MVTDLFIKSYPADYRWLVFALRSIQRFATGFRRVVVVVPEGSAAPPSGTNEEVFYCREYFNPYLFQQWIKLNADAYTDSEFVTFLDSDTIFTRPVSPDLLIKDNRKPVWLYTPYSSLSGDDSKTWLQPTSLAIKRDVPHEFMRRHPFTIQRWALVSFRQWFLRNHGISLEDYIRNVPGNGFSEFNAVAAYLWHFHHDRIEWQNTDDDMGACFVKQHHSYT